MKKILKYFIACIIMIMSTIAIVSATQTYSGRYPKAYTTLTSALVNYTTTYNQTDSGEIHWQVILYNSTNSSSGRKYNRVVVGNLTNNTLWNWTTTVSDGTRHWWYLNITNITVGSTFNSSVVSDVRIFDVDTKFLVFTFGVYKTINMSLDTGDINISGIIKSRTHRLNNVTQTSDDCDSSRAGEFLFNGTGTGTHFPTLILCDGTDWRKLNQTSS